MNRDEQKDTFYFAQSSGDRAFIKWLRDRLIFRYHENPNIDFVLALGNFAEAGKRVKQLEEENKKLKEALNAY